MTAIQTTQYRCKALKVQIRLEKGVVGCLPSYLGHGSMSWRDQGVIGLCQHHFAHFPASQLELPWGTSHGSSKDSISHESDTRQAMLAIVNDKGKTIIRMSWGRMHLNTQKTELKPLAGLNPTCLRD